MTYTQLGIESTKFLTQVFCTYVQGLLNTVLHSSSKKLLVFSFQQHSMSTFVEI